ncbi:hypothetical protein ABXS75_12150 [Roseburia hominis]
MLMDLVEVEGIKIAVRNLEGLRISSNKVLIKSVVWLRNMYECSGKEEYLEKAVWHIYAYLGLGFPYEEGEEEFRIILSHLGKEREELFPARRWIYKKVKLSKTNVRNLLGGWNPVLHSMKINDVVNDIVDKVAHLEKGIYSYHCGKLIAQCEEKELWDQTYRLYIDEEGAVFQNLNQNRYYVLEGGTYDKNSNC